MITLVGLWLAWRIVRAIATVAVIVALAVLVLVFVVGQHLASGVTHASPRVLRQLEHASEKALKR